MRNGDAATEFLHGLRRLARRARAMAVVRRLPPAALAGLGAGLAWLLVRPFVPSAPALGHPLVVPAALLAVALTAGAVAGLLVRVDRVALAVQVDRVLGTPGLASAALEMAEGLRSSAFAAAIVEDAAAALSRATAPGGAGTGRIFGGAGRIIPRPRLGLLPWALAAAAAVVAAGLLPWTLRDLLPAPGRPPRTIVVLGGELEETARRLEEASRREDLREGLALSRELAQLGDDLAMETADAEELAERLADMEQRLGRAYDLLLQRLADAARPAGNGPGDGARTGIGEAAPAPGSGEDDPGGEGLERLDRDDLPPSAREMAEALDLLRELRERSGAAGGGDGDTAGGDGSGGGAGGSADAGPGERADPGAGEGLAGGGEGDGGGDPTGAPTAGTSAVDDERGPATEIARAAPGEPLSADAPVGEGDIARMLVRALPAAGGTTVGEERVLAEYRRQAEAAVGAEQVPLDLRDYVKRYFTGVGVLP